MTAGAAQAAGTEAVEWVVEPRTAPVMGTGVLVTGVLLIAMGIVDVVVSPPATFLAMALHAGFFALLGLLLVVAGDIMRAQKGGLSLDRAAGVLAVHGRSFHDRLSLPFSELIRVRIVFRDAPDLEQEGHARRWAAELETTSGATILLGESTSREDLLIFVRRFEGRLPCPIDESIERAGPGPLPAAAPRLPAPIERLGSEGGPRYRYRITGSWGLAVAMPVLGLTSVVVGGTMMAHVGQNPISGFLFGPVLLVMGAALLLVFTGKSFTFEELQLSKDSVSHRFLLRSRPFARRTLPRSAGLYCRIRPRAAQGTCLEIVGDTSSLLVAAGVTARSRGIDLPALLALSSQLALDLAD